MINIGKFKLGKNGKLEKNEVEKKVAVEETKTAEVEVKKEEAPVVEQKQEETPVVEEQQQESEEIYRITISTDVKDIAFDVVGEEALGEELAYIESQFIDDNVVIVMVPQHYIIKSKIVDWNYALLPSNDYKDGDDA